MLEKKVIIEKDDVIPYVYFVCCLAQNTNNRMHGALSSKGDLVGGIFDRWINIIPESIVFNKYILPKAKEMAGADNCDVKVVSDFYLYDPKEVGIAPDVIGIKVNKNVIPFVKYDDSNPETDVDNTGKPNCWKRQGDSPLIEMKSFMGRKYMVSLRDQGYKGKYLVLVNMQINADYLLPFFNESIFGCVSINDMYNDIMVEHNSNNMLKKADYVKFDQKQLGEIEILRVTTADDFMKTAMKLDKGDIPRYFVDVVERKTKVVSEKNRIAEESLSHYCDIQDKGKKRYRFNEYCEEKIFNGDKTLDIVIEGDVSPENILVIGKTNDDIIVKLRDGISGYAIINDCDVKIEGGNAYNIKFGTFGAIRGEEYFLNRALVSCIPDREEKLIEALSDIIKLNK